MDQPEPLFFFIYWVNFDIMKASQIELPQFDEDQIEENMKLKNKSLMLDDNDEFIDNNVM